MSDSLHAATTHDDRLIVGVAITTTVCRDAQALHQLSPTSCIALGRLMTATALVAGSRPPYQNTSIQVISKGRLGQVFADINTQGHIRGYIDQNAFTLPLLPDEQPAGRRTVAAGIVAGQVSVIRFGDTDEFTQSATELRTGEIDEDVQGFLEQSDQVPSQLVCDVLMGDDGGVLAAGGILIQAMPDADRTAFENLTDRLAEVGFASLLEANGRDGSALLEAVVAGADARGEPQPLAYKCRCSYERVVTALTMLSPEELAEMVDTKETPSVHCEFCSRDYVVEAADVEKVFLQTITARA